MQSNLIRLYSDRVKSGDLRLDPQQEEAVRALSQFRDFLLATNGGSRTPFSWWSPARSLKPAGNLAGIYLFGGVGRGKTMLMDMFFSSITFSKKRRVHFHIFMREVHQWIHSWRQQGKKQKGSGDPIMELARAFSERFDLLCFDEFEISDVADALIIRRIFSGLLDNKVQLVTTSNWHPEDLYTGGLQRELFVPFIAFLKEQLQLVSLGAGVDYRGLKLSSRPVYFSPLDGTARIALRGLFDTLTGGGDIKSEELRVEGRRLQVGRANQGVAWFGFDELCQEAVGVSDYLAILTQFHTLVISDIPIMRPEHRNEARRFSVLIDMLYDHKIKLVCSAAGKPEELYVRGTGAREFLRTVSRLREMQTVAYLSQGRDLNNL
ncbi:MAG: cell division protein ZapE [Pseudomonadota bacterium]|nr:cell division protein ZapE [Pseudomonadota bacterium]